MANCFQCKVYGLNIQALCPEHDEEGNPIKSCYQYEPINEDDDFSLVTDVIECSIKNEY